MLPGSVERLGQAPFTVRLLLLLAVREKMLDDVFSADGAVLAGASGRTTPQR